MVATPGEEASRQSLHGSWPVNFFDRRPYFSRKAENQPYIEWLEDYPLGEGDEDGEDDEECEVEEEGDEEDEGDDDEKEEPADDNVSDEQNVANSTASLPGDKHQADPEGPTSIECLEAYFDHFNESKKENEDDDKQAKQIETNSQNDDHKEEPFNGSSIARVFMKGMIGDEEPLPYRDQVDVVAGFAEQATCQEVGRAVALLDDRDSAGKSLRFKDTDQNAPPQVIDHEESDVVRRVMFLTDLSPSALEAVLATAPRSHASALKNFFYEHLKGKASIGVTIPSQGFKVFTFSLQVPFYILTESKMLFQDPRKGFDEKQLRRSWRLPFLSPSKSAPGVLIGNYCLYETQISVTVTGIDHRVWTAYGLFDTYHGCNDNVETYLESKTRSGEPDPLAAGQLTTYNFISTPRHYYFKVFEIRINQVRKEWRAIVDKVEEDVEKSNHNHPLEIDHWNTRGVREIGVWNGEMVRLLRKLINKLGDTLDAWDRFHKKDIGYFLFDDDLSTTESILKNSVDKVDNVFLDLKDILKKLRKLEKGLCQDSPQGLHAHLSHGNHEAQLFQQKSARHIQILTVITIAYLPLALAAAVFSTTPGVLPFTPDFGRFMLCLFSLGVLVVASIILLFKSHIFVPLIPVCLRWWSRNELWDLEQGEKEE
ncbi:hypothetical protein N431DRAFT_454401 [Stipitochalara longipes BDJ]|nr:hypothetical protein N431DRAFT_454401 [Stipitochalara longipes BDJ]